MALQTLKAYAVANGVPYPHLRRLAAEGLFPVCRIGRRVYVVVEVAEEWCRSGGAALPGGWRRQAKASPAKVA